MKLLLLDFEASYSLFTACKRELKPTRYYENIIHCLKAFEKTAPFTFLQIGYGYVGVQGGVMGRQCYLLSPSGKAIDPSVFIQNKASKLNHVMDYLEYHTFAELSQKRFSSLINNGFEPSLQKELKNREECFYQYAKENGLSIEKRSYDTYLQGFDIEKEIHVKRAMLI